MEKPYQKQLKEKQKQVAELLKPFCRVEPIVGMDQPYHYRNKVNAAFTHNRKGNPISGVYEEGTHRVVPVESCFLEDERADAVIGDIRGLLKSFKIKVYDEDTGYGLLRHVMVRVGHKSGEMMVVLVLSSPVLPSKNHFVKELRKLHPEITTIILNVNERRTSMVLGARNIVLYGKGFMEDTLCDKVFRISSNSFYQVNSAQTEILYKEAIEMAALTGRETVLDAYCGIGTIGIIASDRAKEVLGVELNQDAVRDAARNARCNNVKNIQFYGQDAGEFMGQLAEQGAAVDVVFMDPPRSGSDEAFLSALCRLAPSRVVYISCNPETLARDLKYLTKQGYRVKRAVPVDMFPQCVHCEVCVELRRK